MFLNVDDHPKRIFWYLHLFQKVSTDELCVMLMLTIYLGDFVSVSRLLYSRCPVYDWKRNNIFQHYVPSYIKEHFNYNLSSGKIVLFLIFKKPSKKKKDLSYTVTRYELLEYFAIYTLRQIIYVNHSIRTYKSFFRKGHYW